MQPARLSQPRIVLTYGLAIAFAAAAAAADTVAQNDEKAASLNFKLSDVFGRQVRSEDYKGVPVAVMCGSCWCGGCQSDAAPWARLAMEFGPRGLQFIRSVSYDNELTALEFQRHYSMPIIHLLDPDRSFEKQYNDDGWTFVMLFDRSGRLVYRKNAMRRSELVERMEQLVKPPLEVATIKRDMVSYMRATLERSGEIDKESVSERFPSLAAGPDGRLYLVFTSHRAGQGDIFLRVYDGKSWSEDRPVAGKGAYDASVLVDSKNRVWISWTGVTGGKDWNIFVTSLDASGQPAEPTQLTQADNDAMRARMTCDRKGRIWCTYYRWHQIGDFSRDKEVYVRRLDGTEWSPELHVSPEDVPVWEDHTEPTVVPYGDGVVVGWSWDFHRPKGYTQEPETPTIFLRPIGEDFKMGAPVHASGTTVDVTPAVAVDPKNRVWCAWDASEWDNRLRVGRKTLRVCRRDLSAARPGPEERLGSPAVNVCTPNLVVGKDGTLTAVWSQNDRGDRWVLRRCSLAPGAAKWSASSIVQAEGDPRFPSAAYDSSGTLWIAYSAQTQSGREIKVQAVTVKP